MYDSLAGTFPIYYTSINHVRVYEKEYCGSREQGMKVVFLRQIIISNKL